MDIYPNKGKRLGAFSYGGPGTHPFVMMSYNDDLFSASTLAHELGHSLHSYLSWQTQPLIYARYTLFAAEVASNFNQAMVRDYLLRTQPDREFQIGVIEEAMSNFHRYFFIMPTLARFELELHRRAERGQPLTADSFNGLMADLFAEGYGSDLEMDRLRTGSTWAQFSTHLYSNFYVYQYATGIAGAHALAQGILDKQEGAVDRYLGFCGREGALSAGCAGGGGGGFALAGAGGDCVWDPGGVCGEVGEVCLNLDSWDLGRAWIYDLGSVPRPSFPGD